MFQLTRKIEYSLIVLAHMLKYQEIQPQDSFAEDLSADSEEQKVKVSMVNKVYSVKTVAKEYGIPEMHAAKSFQLLLRAGILNSRQGAKGGYILNCNLQELSLYDLIKAVEGKLEVVRCLKEQSDCHYFNSCNITQPMKRLNSKLVDFYKQTSLDEILAVEPIFHQDLKLRREKII